MTSHLVISSASGSGDPRAEVAFAAAVRLVRRRTPTSIVGLSLATSLSAPAHPDIDFVPESDAAAALADCELLCIVGSLRSREALERAAHHLLLAKLAGVPVALVAVETSDGAEPLVSDVLAQAESVSVAGARTARFLGARRGRRVETVAPLELLVDLGVTSADSEAVRIGICAEALSEALPAQLAALEAALSEAGAAWPARPRLVAGAAGASALPVAGCETHAPPSWVEWARALADCDIVVARAGDPVLGMAAAQGGVPVALLAPGEISVLHVRLGIEDLSLPVPDDAAPLLAAFERARVLGRRGMRQRCAPLRTLAWRALGPLADAGRSQALCTDGWQDASRRALAAAVEIQVRPFLAAGDALGAQSALELWRPVLAGEPRWAEARARAWALLGGDTEARATLEAALTARPGDPGCRIGLARTLMLQGDQEGARRAWEQVVALCPGDAEPVYQLGCLELLSGRPQLALAHWAEAQRRQPGHAESLRALRHCLEAGSPAAVGVPAL